MMTSEARAELTALALQMQELYPESSKHHRLAALALSALSTLGDREGDFTDLATKRINAAVWGSTATNCPLPFAVYRHDDESGVSGPGLVAYGCMFPHTGRVSWAWAVRDKPNTYTWADSFEDVQSIHGHDGKTVFVWLAEALPDLLERERMASFAMDRLRIVEHYAGKLPESEAAEHIRRELAAAVSE